MRDEQTILNDLAAAQKNYSARRNQVTVPERQQLSAQVKALKRELNETLTAGAKECPECGRLPIALKQPGYYEVGCISNSCPERHSAGLSPGEAVRAWNRGDYFERKSIQAVRKATRQLPSAPEREKSFAEKLRELFS